MNEELQEKFDEILRLAEEGRYGRVREEMTELNPADIALLLSQVEEKHLSVAFRILPKELASEVFVYMEPEQQEQLIRSFSDTELSAVLEDLYLDDTVDLIEEMPASVVVRILQNASSADRRKINELLKYPEDSAGTLMTVEYVSLQKRLTVAEAFAKIRREGVDKETVYTCYVTEQRKLIGIVTVKDLLMARDDQPIAEIMDENVIAVEASEDKETVARMFSKYDFMALPVVDSEGRMLGIVTIDDAVDVIEDEATEDIEKMAAILPSDKTYLRTGVFETWRNRIPWLLLLMVSATFTGGIITSFESALNALPALIAFIPMLMDTGGNAGGQSSVTVIRALALGDIELRDALRVLFKEIRVGLICGVTLAAAGALKILLVDNLILRSSVSVGAMLVVCITLCCTVILSKIIGCLLPIGAKALGLDPAVMASPFITTIVDALSLMIYFGVATLMITSGIL